MLHKDSLQSGGNFHSDDDIKQNVLDCIDLIAEAKLPRHKSVVVDFIDAGPGVGITNHEVKFRSAEEIRMMNYDYYIRQHLAPGDSSKNEVERIQSYVGDAVCDGGVLNWEHKTKTDVLVGLDISAMTSSDLGDIEHEKMKHNAFKVAGEVAESIDCAVSPGGFMKSFVTKDLNNLFFWDKSYLVNYLEKKKNDVVPGQNYFLKLERFMQLHFVTGCKYLEFTKFSCINGELPCSHCTKFDWNDSMCKRIPEPFPDKDSRKFKYLHFQSIPTTVDGIKRATNDFNPKVQLLKLCQEGELKIDDIEAIEAFSEKFIVRKELVTAAIEEFSYKEITKGIRERERRNKRVREKEKNYEDFNWLEIAENGNICKLLTQTLDKYLVKNNMQGCLKLNKQAKLAAIKAHITSASLELDNEAIEIRDFEGKDDEMSDPDDDIDEIIDYTHDADSDIVESDHAITEDEENQSGEEEENAHVADIPVELFKATRSGRVAGGWRLAEYIGEKIILDI
eukprot:gene1529-1692_t